jgi:RING finger protein 113A
VCKDYKLTGYCGFGDNCKFLHDRGDYKAGWQIDRDWEIEQQKKNDPLLVADDSDSDDDDMNNVPFVCLICREDYEDPVVTKCGHYFCMTCAIKRYKKTPNCIVCGTGTMGIFNKARDFEKKIEAKKSRKEERERRKQGLDQEDEDAEGSNEPDVEGEMVDLD